MTNCKLDAQQHTQQIMIQKPELLNKVMLFLQLHCRYLYQLIKKTITGTAMDSTVLKTKKIF